MNYRQHISFTAGMRASGLPSSLSDPEEHKRIKRRPDEFKVNAQLAFAIRLKSKVLPIL